MNQVLREEHKFLITDIEYRKYVSKFQLCLSQDIHNNVNGYIVRSLYFDTLNNKDYEEKNQGIEIRKKIRLRVYDVKGDFAFLEMKQKQGVNQLKRSIKIDRLDALEIIEGNYTPLLKYKAPFALECFTTMNMDCYKPKTIIQYNRKAFIAEENKIRITFDSNICATESDFNIFSNNLNMYHVLHPYNVVLEVKYNGFLVSYIKEIIDSVNKNTLSVSKYCLGRAIGLKYTF